MLVADLSASFLPTLIFICFNELDISDSRLDLVRFLLDQALENFAIVTKE